MRLSCISNRWSECIMAWGGRQCRYGGHDHGGDDE